MGDALCAPFSAHALSDKPLGLPAHSFHANSPVFNAKNGKLQRRKMVNSKRDK
ncbi:hypothetical protein [Gordonibacter urolithinfaciens]|uniref:Uncharacterized protein n=1 Tax=Gordonibacter urolithinfaciens TaxID=1335613 RepID=A0A6N8IEA4_9ACTN|nr:hypothetical protein [Gordonibacter urolithinfaciens]MVM53665.1 hypothetical protein [Gordonibacter urolithinfaciens]MVN14125.1 hypothetical protein [Gordonibacter urolithinfaciens]MVN37506.1 hypothetical protein [Gordonibacter urolithinfaciens]MVN55797.1 hypothetical protein [Gordonibacter urolithinfaciens]MVN61097.1 hypothetical protein [Gordonibacter urolithinfaciens]